MSTTNEGLHQVFDEDGNTFEIVSKVAYLIGVPTKFFENDFDPPKLEIYDRLEKNKHAQIIRHLCILRTAFEQNFKNINEKNRLKQHCLKALCCGNQG